MTSRVPHSELPVFGSVDLRGTRTAEDEVRRIDAFLAHHGITANMRLLFSSVVGGKRQLSETAHYGVSPADMTMITALTRDELLEEELLSFPDHTEILRAPALGLYDADFLLPLEHHLYEPLPERTFRDAIVAVMRLRTD